MAPQNTHLLLIFRKAPQGDTFLLLNEQGLPISNTSPILATEGKILVVAPLLLVAVTEAIRANGEVFEGFEYLMSWTANDYKHYYVILEKRPKAQNQNKSQDQQSSSWDQNDNNNSTGNGNDNGNDGWGNNNNNNTNSSSNNNNNDVWGSNDTNNNNNDSGWGSNNDTSNTTTGGWDGTNDAPTTTNDNGGGWGTSTAPPGSPVNTNNDLQNHAWPSSLVNANRSGSGPSRGGGGAWGGGGGGTTSPTSKFDVRDWAMSSSDVGGGSAWGGGSQGATTATTVGSTTPKSEW